MKNYIREVIENYTGHTHDARVESEVRQWLADTSCHAGEKNAELEALWRSADSHTTPGFDESLARMRALTGIDSRARARSMSRRLMLWRSAAAVAVIAIVGVILLKPHTAEPDLLQSYVPVAQQSVINLPDGSVATVNAGSTLLYPEGFTGKTRSVYLIGEASFKVAPDAEHPFIVKSADCQITALGTEFNVEAYADSPEIRATLLTGKVAVDFDSLRQRRVLSPGHQLVYNRNTRRAVVDTHADLDDVTAWQRGEIAMRGLTADEIFTRLGRRFPVEFIYSPHALPADRFSFTFPADASLPEVMDVIAQVMGSMNYRIENDRCYISARR